MVASTQRHVWRLLAWHKRFPKAQLWTCSNIPKKLRNLPFTGILDDTPICPNDFDQALLANKFITEIFSMHKSSKIVVMGDLIQSNPRISNKSFTKFIFKLPGVAHPKNAAPYDIKLSFRITERAKAVASLKKILSWDLDKLIIAYGRCVESNAKGFVKSAFSWLLK